MRQPSQRLKFRETIGITINMDTFPMHLPREHIDFSLVHTQLAYVSLQEEHIGSLHAGIKYLRSTHFICFFPSHYSAAPLDSSQIVHSDRDGKEDSGMER